MKVPDAFVDPIAPFVGPLSHARENYVTCMGEVDGGRHSQNSKSTYKIHFRRFHDVTCMGEVEGGDIRKIPHHPDESS